MEIATRIRKNLTASPVQCDKCEWIATAAMLAGSVVSSLISGNKAKEQANKAAKERTRRENEEKAWYDKQYNMDYLDTKAGQNLMRKAQEVQDNYIRKADGAAAVGGGTAASVAMAKEQANKAMGDTIANVAAQDTARKQQVADQHQSNLSQQSKEREAAYQQTAANTSAAGQNMSNALMTAAVNSAGTGGKTLAGSQPNAANSQIANTIPTNNTPVGNTDVPQGGVSVPSLEDAVGASKAKVRYM